MPAFLLDAGKYSFEGKEWGFVSKEAIELASSMIVLDPQKRIKAANVLNAKWFRTQEQTSHDDSNPIGSMMMDRLRQFGGMQRMKRLALTCLVRTLNNRDVKSLLVRAASVHRVHGKCTCPFCFYLRVMTSLA
jgi:serine/threonine protein kinase